MGRSLIAPRRLPDLSNSEVARDASTVADNPAGGSGFLSRTAHHGAAMREAVNARLTHSRYCVYRRRLRAAAATGSNSENSSSPARNPPTWASQATLWSSPDERHRAEPEQQIEAEPDAEKREHARIAQRNQQRRRRDPVGVGRDRARHMSSGPPGWKAKRAAAPIMPEIAADAPTIGAQRAGMRRRDAPARRPQPSPRRTAESAARRTGAPPGCRRRAARPR